MGLEISPSLSEGGLKGFGGPQYLTPTFPALSPGQALSHTQRQKLSWFFFFP
jgi:hypothetical protein